MAIEKEIRINVDNSPLNRLRQDAEALARDMIRNSRAFATSGDEVIADLEEQINLLERRNRINEQYARSQIQQARQQGAAPQQVQQQQQAVGQQAQENKIIVDLIREVIDSIKQTSKDEIRSEREDVERRIRASRTVGQLAPDIDPTQALTETLQRQYLGLEGGEAAHPSEVNQRQTEKKNTNRRRLEKVLNRAAQAENEYTFLSSALEGIPVFGPALATVAARGISAAEGFEEAAIEYGRLHRYGRTGTALEYGRTVGRAAGIDTSMFGVTPGELLAQTAGFERVLQRDISDPLNVVGAQRVLGIDPNTITQLLTQVRYDRQLNDPSQILAQFDKYLRETGRAVSAIPELTATFSSAASQILATRGEFDAQSLARTITGISRQTGFEGQRLDRLTGAFGQLGRTANPVTRALLMSAFRETDPNASFVDIQERLEGGLSAESRPGLQRFFEIMRERTGGGDALTLALQTALPQLSIRDIRDVIKSGGFAKALQREQVADRRDFAVEAPEFVGPIERSGKMISSALELAGDALVEVIDEIKNKLSAVLGELEEFGVQGDPNRKTESEKANEITTNKILTESAGRPI